MQYNIYFRKENWEKFTNEENKSALINDLLADHYGLGSPQTKQAVAQVSSTPVVRTLADMVADDEEQDEPDYSDYKWDPIRREIWSISEERYVKGEVLNGKVIRIY